MASGECGELFSHGMKLLLFGNASAARLLHCAFELRLSHEQFQQFVDGFHDDTVLLNPSVQISSLVLAPPRAELLAYMVTWRKPVAT